MHALHGMVASIVDPTSEPAPADVPSREHRVTREEVEAAKLRAQKRQQPYSTPPAPELPPLAVPIETGAEDAIEFAEHLIDLIRRPLPSARSVAERAFAIRILHRARAEWADRAELGMRVVRTAINELEDARVALEASAGEPMLAEHRDAIIAREAHAIAMRLATADPDGLGLVSVDAWTRAIRSWRGYLPRERWGYDWASVVFELLKSADLTGARDAKNLADTFYRSHEPPAK